MSERRFHLALILVIPLVMLAANPNVFVTPGGNGFTDPWAYTGYFLSLPHHIARFGGAYYGNRLSWIVPGYVVHYLLPPLAANYVLHLTFFYGLLVAAYLLMSCGVNPTSAMLGTLLLGWNPVIQDALGWDYVDGAGITYIVVSLFCLERASTRRHRAAWSAAAGFAAACLVATNLTLVALLPACAVFLLLRTDRPRVRAIALTTVAAAAGAVAAFAVLGAVNRSAGGPWLFLLPSVKFAQALYGQANPWKTASYPWGDAFWVALPLFAAVGAVLSLAMPPRGDRSFARAIHAAFLTAAAAWAMSDIAGNSALLQYPYYASYLAPLAILSLAVQGETLAFSPRAAWALEIAAFAVLATAHVLFLRRGGYFLYRMAVLFHASGTAVIVTSVAMAAGLLAVLSLRIVRPPSLRWAVFLPAIAVAFAVPHYRGSNPVDGRAEYETTALAHRFITSAIGTHTIRIWYPPAEYTSPPFRSIASTYLWKWNLVNETLPALTPEDAAKVPSDTRLIMLLAHQADAGGARAALRRFGFDATDVAHQDFGEGSRAVSVVIVDLAPVKQGE